ncbi:hypothetical protein Tco_0831930 [Tanacetum coccineum]
MEHNNDDDDEEEEDVVVYGLSRITHLISIPHQNNKLVYVESVWNSICSIVFVRKYCLGFGISISIGIGIRIGIRIGISIRIDVFSSGYMSALQIADMHLFGLLRIETSSSTKSALWDAPHCRSHCKHLRKVPSILFAGGSNVANNNKQVSFKALEVLYVLDSLKGILPLTFIKFSTKILYYFKSLLALHQSVVSRRISDSLYSLYLQQTVQVSPEALVDLLSSLAIFVSSNEMSGYELTFTSRLLDVRMKKVFSLKYESCIANFPLIFSALKGLFHIHTCIDTILIKEGVDPICGGVKKDRSAVIEKLYTTVESLLDYSYSAVWDMSFQVVVALFDKLGVSTNIVWRVSLSDAWVTGRGSPYYTVDNRVVAVRAHALCCRVPVILLAEWSMLGRFGSFRVLGLGPLLIVWSRLAARLTLYVIMCPQSSDPLPVDEAVDLPCVELLNENRTLIRKYPETFLCLMGLSRSFIETDVRPTLLHDNDEGWYLVYIYAQGGVFVEAEEQTLAENEVSLITETEDMRKKRVAFVSGSPLVKKAQTDGIVISDSRPSTASKSPTALQRLIRQGEQAADGSGSAAPDALHDNVRTRPPSSRFVVLSSGSADTDIPATSQVVSLVSSSQAGVSLHVTESAGDGRPLSAPELETETLSATPSQGSSADDSYESQNVDSATAMNVYIPNWNVTNNARVDNPFICRSFLDHVTPLGYWAALRNQCDVGEKFERKFTNSVAIVQQRDAEVVELKAKLEKSESEAAEVEVLRKRVSDLEAMVAVKVGEAASLTTQNAGLLEKDAAEWRFAERTTELDARIADVRRDMDNC